MKKIGSFFLISLSLSVMLGSQTLSELAKMEKARRAGLRGRKSIEITNQNFLKYRKNPAVSMTEQAQNASTAPVKPQTPPEEPPEPPRLKQTRFEEKALTGQKVPPPLEKDWEKAQEYVELLTLKMNALWQEFYSMDDMTSRDSIQMQIDTTYQKLLKAQEEEQALRKKVQAKKKRLPLPS